MSERIPKSWKVTSLGKSCEILDSLRVPVNSEERSKRLGSYSYYGANGIQGFIDNYIFEGPSVLLAEDGGNFDEYSTRPIAQYVTGKYWVNNHAHVLRGTESCQTKWVYYSLVHKNILKFINGGTRAKLNQSDLKEIPILVPPLPEQQKIALILTSVDEVIEKTQSQLNKLEDLKKATMNELLTRGIGHTEFKDSELGRIPKSWKIVSLEQLCVLDSPITYGVLKPGSYINGGVPLLQINDLESGSIKKNGLHRISEELDYEYRRSRVKPNDLVISLVGTIGQLAIIPNWLNGANIHRNLGRIRSNISRYIYQYLQSQKATASIGKISAGSSQSALNLSALRDFLIVTPLKEEQEIIQDILEAMDKNIQLSNHKLYQIKSLKKSLMQDLLTGKVRVTVN